MADDARSSDAAAASRSGWFARLGRTPVTDLLQGRISGRMDARHQAANAHLPAELASLVDRTVRLTRLRHREQHEIAGELISYLQDALQEGQSADELVRGFGNPAVAARLMRRACLKRRSRAYRLLMRSLQAAALLGLLLAVGFSGLVIRHVMSRPSVAYDYLSELNRPALDIPEQERAWPLYRAALMTLERFPVDETDISEEAYLHDWPTIRQYLRRNRGAFALARQAADKPRLGFLYNDPADDEWLKLIDKTRLAPHPAAFPLYFLEAPHLEEMSRLRRLLLADSRRAVADRAGREFLDNMHALLGMAEHLRDGTPTLATELQAFECFRTSVQLIGAMLADEPTLLAEEELIDLAHRLAAYSGGGTLRARLNGEQLLFEDLLQHIYTDDGTRDGRLAPAGWRFYQQLDNPDVAQLEQSAWGRVTEPIKSTTLSLLTAGRKDMSHMAELLALRYQAERATPMWQWERSSAETQVEQLARFPQRLRYWPVLYLFPGVEDLALRGEFLTQQRDATLTAIALEIYRRRNGDWPESLKELTPFPLPAVPIDRYTGQPLLYRLVGGRPLLYSTGLDRDDDGGRMHRMGNNLAQRWEPWTETWQQPRLVNDGFGNLITLPPKFDWDWILWPEPLSGETDDEDDQDPPPS